MNSALAHRVNSRVETARWLVEKKIALRIPSYQRPYVWPSEDVTKLLTDIGSAYDAKDQHYYVGTLLSASNKPANSAAQITYELIDGQQRSTTLMLMALAFREYLPTGHPLNQLTVLGKQPRLTFSVRDQVQELLGYWAGLQDYPFPGEEAIQTDDYLKHIYSALVAVKNQLQNWQDDKDKGCDYLEAVAHFLYGQVKWVNNTMPAGMDLNKLFATMNTSGIQLEQTDILKSLLLKKITTNKHCYDAIWQACENLNNYFERNLRKLFPLADWNTLEYSQLHRYSPELFPLVINSGDQQTTPMTIEALAQQATAESADMSKKDQGKTTDEQGSNEVYCRSIISFALLLMHTYRIYLGQTGQKDIEVRLSDKRLSEAFAGFIQTAVETEARSFIECLWQVRYQFDRWVIKWVELAGEDTEYLRLSTVSRSNSSGTYRFSRSPLESSTLSNYSNLTQLQSVRLFTGERSAQYWLTPFLGWLVRENPSDNAKVISQLEHIDNQLSLAQITQKEASFELQVKGSTAISNMDSLLAVLREDKGTGFEHYWFQKLEYILWREQKQFDCFKTDKLSRYRIASRNSVEHVHPQHEENRSKLDKQWLDSFGNLALLSPGENSSYSNQTVGKKKADFKDKRNYDSLKLAHIFHKVNDTDDWNIQAIKDHRDAMLNLMAAHYQELA